MTNLDSEIIERYFIFSLSPSQLSISPFFVSKTNISPHTSHLQMPRYCLMSPAFIPQNISADFHTETHCGESKRPDGLPWVYILYYFSTSKKGKLWISYSRKDTLAHIILHILCYTLQYTPMVTAGLRCHKYCLNYGTTFTLWHLYILTTFTVMHKHLFMAFLQLSLQNKRKYQTGSSQFSLKSRVCVYVNCINNFSQLYAENYQWPVFD